MTYFLINRDKLNQKHNPKLVTKLIDELEREFNSLHDVICKPAYEGLVEKNLDILLDSYITSLDYLLEWKGEIKDEDKKQDKFDFEYRYLYFVKKEENKRRHDQTKWKFWKEQIEQTDNDVDFKKAVNFVKNAFTRLGSKVDTEIKKLPSFGIHSLFSTFKRNEDYIIREIEKVEEIIEREGPEKAPGKRDFHAWSAALFIAQKGLKKKSEEVRKRAKEEIRRIRQEINKVKFYNEFNSQKNVVVHDEYSSLPNYPSISDWEYGLRKEIDWLQQLDLEQKRKLLDELEETLHSRASFYFSPKSPENDSSETLNEWEKMVEGAKHSAINEIKVAFQSAGLSESDLSAENQNWQAQIKAAAEESNLNEIEDIESKVLADIKSKEDNENIQPPETSDEYSLEKNNRSRDLCIWITEQEMEKFKITDENLIPKNQNWKEQLNACQGSGQEISSKIIKIFVEVGLEIRQKGAEKQKATELNEVINKYENGNKSNKEELTNDLRNLNKNLGDEEPETKRKLRAAKKQMAQSDPDMYFNSFVELVEKETKKLEEETKKEQKLKKVLEISKSSSEEEEKEEKDLLAGKITDLSKREEIIERIEKKLEIKLRAWKWYKKVKEWAKWLETKAKLLLNKNKVGFETQKSQIEKEVENLKNTSNTIDKQAYQANKQEITELLSKLSTISQNDTINNDGSIAPLVYLGIVISASFVGLLIILSQRKRQKN